MIKVGDWVEVIGHDIYYSKGERFKVIRIEDGFVYSNYDIGVSNFIVQVVRATEANKRGAKFGVCGTVKSTGAKWVFVCESGSLWRGMADNGVVVSGRPSDFRLDHESEYREIPFSEATHEQRMDVSALRFDGTPVEQIFRFDNGEYMFTISACKAVANAWNILKVRIPT